MQIKDIVTTKPLVLFDSSSMIRLTDDVKDLYNDVTVVGIRIYDDECHVFALGDYRR